MNIPDWMNEETEYIPQRDREGFISRSLLSLLGTLSRFRSNGKVRPAKIAAQTRLICSLLAIIMVSLSRNAFFSYAVLAMLLARMCFLPSDRLPAVIKGAAVAAAFSVMILLPSVFMGSPRTMLTVSLKVFISAGLLGLISACEPFNRITASLRSFGIPDLFIFILDLTLKYIVLLGEACEEALTAMKLRSVGRNASKEKAFSGVLGAAFLKSKRMEDDLSDAMACRGFEGEYSSSAKRSVTVYDVCAYVFTIALLALFLFLERSI